MHMVPGVMPSRPCSVHGISALQWWCLCTATKFFPEVLQGPLAILFSRLCFSVCVCFLVCAVNLTYVTVSATGCRWKGSSTFSSSMQLHSFFYFFSAGGMFVLVQRGFFLWPVAFLFLCVRTSVPATMAAVSLRKVLACARKSSTLRKE